MNFIGDLRGRKFALLIDLIIAVISSLCNKYLYYFLVTIIGAYAQSTGLLCFSTFLAGWSGYSLVIVCYIMAADVCE